MCRKIRCDRESETFYKIFRKLNKANMTDDWPTDSD